MAAVVAVLLVSAGVVAIIATSGTKHTGSSTPTTSERTAIQQWWSTAADDFTAVQNSVDDLRQAVKRQDSSGLEAACQRLHDAAEVKMQAHLPTPDPDLTAELRAMIEDYHNATHLCLSVAAGSMNNYSGEFPAYMDEADKHLKAAQDIINRTLAVA